MSDIGAPGQTEPEILPETEQQGIQPLDDNPSPLEPAPEEDKSQPGKPVGPAVEEEKALDPRAQRIEEIAEKRREDRAAELVEQAEAMEPAPGAKPDAPAVAPERMIKLKIRGEVVELPESEVITRAQKVESADTYLADSRKLLEDTKEAIKKPQQQEAPPPPPAPPENRVTKALEMVQLGGDPIEASAMLDEELSMRAQRIARGVVDGDAVARGNSAVDADALSAFAEIEKETPHLVADELSVGILMDRNAAVQRSEIQKFLTGAPEQTRAAFAKAGITAEGVATYSGRDTYTLYRDMTVKGYGLPRPSEVTKAVAKMLAERFPAPPPLAPAILPTPEAGQKTVVSLDRTARKEALQQPERTTIPRPTPGRLPAPRTEPQRAQSAREEMKANRRKGVSPR